jgi:hypothetical protein
LPPSTVLQTQTPLVEQLPLQQDSPLAQLPPVGMQQFPNSGAQTRPEQQSELLWHRSPSWLNWLPPSRHGQVPSVQLLPLQQSSSAVQGAPVGTQQPKQPPSSPPELELELEPEPLDALPLELLPAAPLLELPPLDAPPDVLCELPWELLWETVLLTEPLLVPPGLEPPLLEPAALLLVLPPVEPARPVELAPLEPFSLDELELELAETPASELPAG